MPLAVREEEEQRDFQIRKLGPCTGAEVTGVDLGKPVDAAAREALNKALVEHICLVFPKQNLSPAAYIEAMKLFGTPVEQNYSLYHLENYPLINTVSNKHLGPEGKRVYHSSYWHSDHTNRERPPKYTVLYAVEMPDAGGETAILNMRDAYEALPADFKKRLDGLQTFNVQKGSAAKKSSLKQVLDDDWKHFEKPTPHPLVRTHPENGTKAIYFHRGKVENVTGMTPEASQDFLDEIMEKTEKPAFIYRHPWRIGDVMIWDNRSAMHMACPNFDLQQHRLLYRIIIDGDRPF